MALKISWTTNGSLITTIAQPELNDTVMAKEFELGAGGSIKAGTISTITGEHKKMAN